MIHPSIENYLENHTSEEPEVLKKLRRDTHLKTVYPQMLSGHVMGKFLEMISRMVAPTRILEIGTFTGYSAICLAQGLKPEGKIFTVESNPEMTEFAAPYFAEANLQDRVVQLCGNALEIIATLDFSFDLVFIDAAKHEYTDYYRAVFGKVAPGGIMLVDNVLWDGKVLKDEPDDKDTEGIMRFNEFVKNDDRVDKVMLPLRDGIFLIRKKML
jgi:predicted O-methyltransferase YrrM